MGTEEKDMGLAGEYDLDLSTSDASVAADSDLHVSTPPPPYPPHPPSKLQLKPSFPSSEDSFSDTGLQPTGSFSSDTESRSARQDIGPQTLAHDMEGRVQGLTYFFQSVQENMVPNMADMFSKNRLDELCQFVLAFDVDRAVAVLLSTMASTKVLQQQKQQAANLIKWITCREELEFLVNQESLLRKVSKLMEKHDKTTREACWKVVLHLAQHYNLPEDQVVTICGGPASLVSLLLEQCVGSNLEPELRPANLRALCKVAASPGFASEVSDVQQQILVRELCTELAQLLNPGPAPGAGLGPDPNLQDAGQGTWQGLPAEYGLDGGGTSAFGMPADGSAAIALPLARDVDLANACAISAALATYSHLGDQQREIVHVEGGTGLLCCLLADASMLMTTPGTSFRPSGSPPESAGGNAPAAVPQSSSEPGAVGTHGSNQPAEGDVQSDPTLPLLSWIGPHGLLPARQAHLPVPGTVAEAVAHCISALRALSTGATEQEALAVMVTMAAADSIARVLANSLAQVAGAHALMDALWLLQHLALIPESAGQLACAGHIPFLAAVVAAACEAAAAAAAATASNPSTPGGGVLTPKAATHMAGGAAVAAGTVLHALSSPYNHPEARAALCTEVAMGQLVAAAAACVRARPSGDASPSFLLSPLALGPGTRGQPGGVSQPPTLASLRELPPQTPPPGAECIMMALMQLLDQPPVEGVPLVVARAGVGGVLRRAMAPGVPPAPRSGVTQPTWAATWACAVAELLLADPEAAEELVRRGLADSLAGLLSWHVAAGSHRQRSWLSSAPAARLFSAVRQLAATPGGAAALRRAGAAARLADVVVVLSAGQAARSLDVMGTRHDALSALAAVAAAQGKSTTVHPNVCSTQGQQHQLTSALALMLSDADAEVRRSAAEALVALAEQDMRIVDFLVAQDTAMRHFVDALSVDCAAVALDTVGGVIWWQDPHLTITYALDVELTPEEEVAIAGTPGAGPSNSGDEPSTSAAGGGGRRSSASSAGLMGPHAGMGLPALRTYSLVGVDPAALPPHVVTHVESEDGRQFLAHCRTVPVEEQAAAAAAAAAAGAGLGLVAALAKRGGVAAVSTLARCGTARLAAAVLQRTVAAARTRWLPPTPGASGGGRRIGSFSSSGRWSGSSIGDGSSRRPRMMLLGLEDIDGEGEEGWEGEEYQPLAQGYERYAAVQGLAGCERFLCALLMAFSVLPAPAAASGASGGAPGPDQREALFLMALSPDPGVSSLAARALERSLLGAATVESLPGPSPVSSFISSAAPGAAGLSRRAGAVSLGRAAMGGAGAWGGQLAAAFGSGAGAAVGAPPVPLGMPRLGHSMATAAAAAVATRAGLAWRYNLGLVWVLVHVVRQAAPDAGQASPAGMAKVALALKMLHGATGAARCAAAAASASGHGSRKRSGDSSGGSEAPGSLQRGSTWNSTISSPGGGTLQRGATFTSGAGGITPSVSSAAGSGSLGGVSGGAVLVALQGGAPTGAERAYLRVMLEAGAVEVLLLLLDRTASSENHMAIREYALDLLMLAAQYKPDAVLAPQDRRKPVGQSTDAPAGAEGAGGEENKDPSEGDGNRPLAASVLSSLLMALLAAWEASRGPAGRSGQSRHSGQQHGHGQHHGKQGSGAEGGERQQQGKHGSGAGDSEGGQRSKHSSGAGDSSHRGGQKRDHGSTAKATHEVELTQAQVLALLQLLCAASDQFKARLHACGAVNAVWHTAHRAHPFAASAAKAALSAMGLAYLANCPPG